MSQLSVYSCAIMEALKMERPTNSWNDDRLDELSHRVDEGFKEMREGFARVDREMREGFARIDQRFEGVDQRFEGVASREGTNKVMGEIRAEIRLLNEKIDRLTHGLMMAGVSFGLTAIAAATGLVVTQI
jgi:hypothetical protein